MKDTGWSDKLSQVADAPRHPECAEEHLKGSWRASIQNNHTNDSDYRTLPDLGCS